MHPVTGQPQPPFAPAVYLFAFQLGEQGVHDACGRTPLERVSREDFRLGYQDGTMAARAHRRILRARLAGRHHRLEGSPESRACAATTGELRVQVAEIRKELTVNALRPCPVCAAPRVPVPSADPQESSLVFLCSEVVDANLSFHGTSQTSCDLAAHRDASRVRVPAINARVLMLCASVERVLAGCVLPALVVG